MNMIISWIGFLFRQTAYAFTTVSGILLLGEILAPGLVLPFLNLHALVLVSLGMCLVLVAWPGVRSASSARSILSRTFVLAPIMLLLIVMTWIALAGASISAILLTVAVTLIIVAFSVAIIHPN